MTEVPGSGGRGQPTAQRLTAQQSPAPPTTAADGSVVVAGGARIPVRNVWLLLLYASEFYQSGPEAFDGIEEYPEKLPELLAEVLVASTEDRLRRPLTPSFAKTSRDLSRVRGGIDTLRTESHQLLSRGLVACRFEELTVDTPRNRLIRTALDSIARLCSDEELVRRCQGQSQRLERLGVGRIDLRAGQRDAGVRLTRNDAQDRSVLLAARLALELALPFGRTNPGHGRGQLDERQFRHLFERAVGGFYRVHGRPRGWAVERGRKVGWNALGPTPGMAAVLPHMVTDVWIDSPRSGRRLIVDTKFTPALRAGRFARETLDSGHLYQLYTYVREQEDPADPASLGAGGLLLYPSAGSSLAESFVTAGHRLGAATVDLSVASVLVRDQLIAVVGPYLSDEPA
ncbi:5-methylcytosine restriction system specificity protein McrC [Sinomonas mesophila]|uniref:5-methylcytosine restriction system specificity protein McrC n=1 Tax=Sinomonas mesophila TaxID=1531955 RepID=UPI00158AC34D|nr:5-methylcytosine-specific restriction endonuclease system specificity protein McrC [Sinomonas mesophila]